jgi:ABC-2 type transport system ATP-binding protein
MDTIIRTQDLTRRFDALTAVDHLNLEVGRGEIFGLVGPDGAGKTTTLRLLCGLMDPTEGEAWVGGENVVRNTAAVKDRIGYMAQRFGLYLDLTVEENIEFYSDLFGISSAERDKFSPQLLRMTRMEEFRKRPAGKLSGGMKQKLGLMCTLLHRPEILFLDEPTNGVDPVSRRDFWAILYQLVKDGITVLVTTAYLDEAERCGRVGLMYHGRLIECAAPEAIRQQVADECYQVEAADTRTARDLLRQAEGVVSVEPSGTTLHLFLTPAVTSPDTLCRKLEQGGVGRAVLQRIVPSLEDVFILLVSKAEKQ